jgi:DNA invertase Pin-like site-specific DNA recombinase
MGATFKSLGDAWADTTSAHARLMLTVLCCLPKFERELIRHRTEEGWTHAKAKGVKFGPKFKLTLRQVRETPDGQRREPERDRQVVQRQPRHHHAAGRAQCARQGGGSCANESWGNSVAFDLVFGIDDVLF